MGIQLKELSKLGYTNNVARSLAINIVSKYCKHDSKEQILTTLSDLLENPEKYKDNERWGKLAEHFAPTVSNKEFTIHNLSENYLPYKTYGGKFIESLAKQQMELAMRLPVTIAGALMPDAHAGYGLPIGGVLAVENAVIPYAVGMDIGCRMSLTIFDVKADFLKRYSHQIKEALKEYTHFGMEGGLPFTQEHRVLDRPEFQLTSLLKQIHGKAVRQLGTSGGGNHFVEFGEIELFESNITKLPAGKYMALLSHSGSRGMGAAIARHYSDIARETCKLPREAQHFAWLGLDTEAGQEYWMSMNLAGDFAQACHEQIHLNLSKVLGLKPIANVNNHHNFAWREEIETNRYAIVHRKGATPAAKGIAGFIPGSMATAGYLVCGKGEIQSLNSASHGAGRAMSRQKAKEQFTQSALKKLLSQQQVTLIGGSVEEMPFAYKDIDKIMPAQESLVEIHGRFVPRIVRMHKE
ncbi:RtcB family protein [Dysgonomonas macrotermitis]|uniref:3'-phosphate/5'-hydroxy nucleic acid ligase n=1 Tax=Dysgonomonas macrotermitis TaxID=1346286 RepID=A0A1M4WBH4_9BACT|nr:RtcB family protein [Dysgonomonas macrotermitis]SHE78618.1 tRNA-splicing ligase RtcB [Dysgonomonas macrotermitis]